MDSERENQNEMTYKDPCASLNLCVKSQSLVKIPFIQLRCLSRTAVTTQKIPIYLDSLLILQVHFKLFRHTVVHSPPQNQRHENRAIGKLGGVSVMKHWKECERKKKKDRSETVTQALKRSHLEIHQTLLM